MDFKKEILDKIKIDDMPNAEFRHIAETCGIDVALKLLLHIPGWTIFVPCGGLKKSFGAFIFEEYDGTTYSIKKIALKYHTTEQSIREIIQQHRLKPQHSPGQIGLFKKD